MTLEPKDLIEIQMLYARYSQLFDAGDLDAWLELFTVDVSYRWETHSDIGEWSNPYDVRGREQLRSFCAERWDTIGGGVRHFSGNLVIDDSTDRVTGEGSGFSVATSTNPASMRITGHFEDELVDDGSGWRFKSRIMKLDR